MIPSSVEAFAYTVICVFCLAWGGSARGGDEADARRVLELAWGSVETLSLHSRETLTNKSNGLSQELVYIVDFGKDNRWAMEKTETREGVPRLRTETREDGRRRYQILSFPSHPEIIDRMMISNATMRDNHYSGIMNCAIWILRPGGKQLNEVLKSDVSLTTQRDGTVALSGECNSQPLWCELDPAHDYLPRRLRLGDLLDIRVTRFQRAAERWFPSDGKAIHRFESHGKRDEQSISFTVFNVSVNEPIPSSRFETPTLPDGVQVIDETTQSISIKGGYRPRKVLLSKYMTEITHPDTQSSRTATSNPILVEDTGVPWSGILASTGGALLLGGLLLRLRSTLLKG